MQRSTLVNPDKILNQVRAIFLGHSEVGKTSLINCLQGLSVVIDKKKTMLPGIEIHEWSLPDSSILAHLWDFEDSAIEHIAHQFFLRNDCLYVLVMDSHSGVNVDNQVQFWLKHIQEFAAEAPVMLVGNKADRIPISWNMSNLRDNYDSNIVDFYNLSCTQYNADYGSDFKRFKRDFIAQLKKLGLYHIKFGNLHLNVINELSMQSRQQSFLTCSEFNEICEQSGVHKENGLIPTRLLNALDTLGVLIQFPDLPYFCDTYVLNPRWLTYGVHAVFCSHEAKNNKWILSKKQVVAILGKESIQDERGSFLHYPTHMCGFIIELMCSFKLCYPLRNKIDTLVFPGLLPATQPELCFEKSQLDIVFKFRFPHLLPRHVMPMFTVSRYDEIEGEQVWQTGVVLKNKTHAASALITVNDSDRVITFNLQGPGAKEYFHILYDEVFQIARGLKDPLFKVWVVLPKDALIKKAIHHFLQEEANYMQLLGTLQAGQKLYISTSGAQYDLFKILGGIMTDDMMKNETDGRFTIQGNNNVVQIGNDMDGGSGNVTINQLSEDLHAELRKLIDEIKIEIGDSENKNKALRELELIREHLTQAVDGSQLEKKDAKNGLEEFIDKFKNGVGYVANVTKNVDALKEKLPALIASVIGFTNSL